jgi:AcrR family transcriptional regulator
MKSQLTKSEAARPRVLGLNADRIATAALHILDRDGLKALSARRLAADLGCEAMSLYSHVASMDAVFDLVVDRLLSTLPTAAGSPDHRQAIKVEALAFLEMAETHPHAFGLVATRRWRTPVALAFAKRLVSRLIVCGLPPRAALRHARIIGVFLNGAGLGLASWRLIPGEAESNPWQTTVSGQVSDAQSVKTDLIVGLDAILDALGKEVADAGRKTQSIILGTQSDSLYE